MEKHRSTKYILAIFILSCCGFIIFEMLKYDIIKADKFIETVVGSSEEAPAKEAKPQKTEEEIREETTQAILKAASYTPGQENTITVSDSRALGETGTDEIAGKTANKIFTGRRINIAVTGVDSRLGSRFKHADANHVLSFLLDSGKIEIISVPRDTPAEANMPDTSGQNKLTVVRATRGRNGYLQELARIARVDKIHYYVEFGFSQAMGLLEFLGYKNSGSTLQVLRQRTGIMQSDYQRHYNQAQFIRQAVCGNFNKLDGVMGSIIVRGALGLVETNINSDVAWNIIDQMKHAGFKGEIADVNLYIRPPLGQKFKVYDFADKNVMENLSKKIESDVSRRTPDSAKFNARRYAQRKLLGVVASAQKNIQKNPQQVINSLSPFYEQRAWFQIEDMEVRLKVRDEICNLLAEAYEKRKENYKAEEVKKYLETEKDLFKDSFQGVYSPYQPKMRQMR